MAFCNLVESLRNKLPLKPERGERQATQGSDGRASKNEWCPGKDSNLHGR
jgi:hypothetical protein